MKKISNIAVFDSDEYFLAMLKGYCYANNIPMTKVSFNMDGINVIEKLNAALIFVPIPLLNAVQTVVKTSLLKLASSNSPIRICGLNKKPADTSVQVPEWVDGVITDPLDICEIDNYIKKRFLTKNLSVVERRQKERRSFMERRKSAELHYGDLESNRDEYKENNSSSFLKKSNNTVFKKFQIDKRNRCVFLNGHKVDLTRKEYDLFELLSTDANRVFLTEEIISHLWPENNRATKSDLYQYMHLLRKKIEKDPNNPQWIMTIKGFGYRLNINRHEDLIQEAIYQ